MAKIQTENSIDTIAVVIVPLSTAAVICGIINKIIRDRQKTALGFQEIKARSLYYQIKEQQLWKEKFENDKLDRSLDFGHRV